MEQPRGRAGEGVWHLGFRPFCSVKTAVQPGPGDPASASILGAGELAGRWPTGIRPRLVGVPAMSLISCGPTVSSAPSIRALVSPRLRPVPSQRSYLKWPWFASFLKKKIIPVLSRVPQGQLSPLKMSVGRQPPVRRWEEAGGPDGNAEPCGWNLKKINTQTHTCTHSNTNRDTQ